MPVSGEEALLLVSVSLTTEKGSLGLEPRILGSRCQLCAGVSEKCWRGWFCNGWKDCTMNSAIAVDWICCYSGEVWLEWHAQKLHTANMKWTFIFPSSSSLLVSLYCLYCQSLTWSYLAKQRQAWVVKSVSTSQSWQKKVKLKLRNNNLVTGILVQKLNLYLG